MLSRKLKVVMITSLQPYSNYSQFLCRNIDKKKIDLIVYCESNKNNLKIKDCGRLRLILDSSLMIYFSILRNLMVDKPDLIHFQYELNMYGGTVVNVLFPGFLTLLKLLGFKILVTMHSVVKPSYINKDFIRMFRGDKSTMPSILVKMYFLYSNYLISISSNIIVVHTKMLKNILSNNYFVNRKKIEVIPMGVPIMFDRYENKSKNYFLYFGYIVRRKGLENMLKGYKKFLDKSKKNLKYKLLIGGGVIKGQEFAKKEFLNLVKKLNIQKNVDFLGFLREDQIHKYHSEALCCAIPSLITISASGPLSMVFGHGKFCLASNVGNFKEEIKHLHDGYLVDNNKWEQAFEFAVENKTLIKQAQENVKLKAIKRSWENTANKNITIYEKLIH